MLKTVLRTVLLGWWIIPVAWIVGVPLVWLVFDTENPREFAMWATRTFTVGQARADELFG